MQGTWPRVLVAAALAELVTGLIVLATPTGFVQLLFAEQLTESAVVMTRIAGAALIGLGIACWPRGAGSSQAYGGMLAYSVLAALLLASAGMGGRAGAVLWPAVYAHALLSAALAVGWLKHRSVSPQG